MTRRKWYTHDFLAESQKLLERAPISKDAGLIPPAEGLSNINKYPGHLPDIARYDGNSRNQGLVGVDGVCVKKALHMALEEDFFLCRRVSEVLEYIKKSENDKDEEIFFSDDKYVPPDEEYISLDEAITSNFPVQCTGRKTTSGKICINKLKKLSDSNPEEMNSGTLVANDGTCWCWESIPSGSCRCGRTADHKVFKEKSVPTSNAKRNIEMGYAISSWRPLIHKPKLQHIKNCTQEEAHWQLEKNEWSTTLDAFISILYD
ncbi:uncharacterized protein TNCV_886361 [Trichonephila clavipes]|nr:uncharacterized protein TNCV_886361 [Trichonephila clavipes]